jgi:hypothetical protein
MKKSDHHSYLSFNLTKVKNDISIDNHQEQGVITFFHDEVDQIEI